MLVVQMDDKQELKPARKSYSRMLRERLRAQRERLGLTQAEVASRVSSRLEQFGGKPIGHSTISNYETFQRQPRIDEMAAWARAVGLRLVIDLDDGSSDRVPVLVSPDIAEDVSEVALLLPAAREAVQALRRPGMVDLVTKIAALSPEDLKVVSGLAARLSK